MSPHALPVVVAFDDPDLQADITAFVESHLGWQVVDDGPHLPARLCLSDRVHPGLPTIGIARAAVDPRPLIRAGATEVVIWPDEADRLVDLVPDTPTPRPADRIIVVAGLAPRVGTTVVSLAIGAIQAWRGWHTTVLTGAAGRRLAGLAGDARGSAVEGVPDLEVYSSLGATRSPRPDVLVIDRGVSRAGHIVVGVPDHDTARALSILPDETPVVLRGRGGMYPGEITRMVGSRPAALLQDSFRVAHAALHGRVPIGLPGSYVRALHAIQPATAAVRRGRTGEAA